MVKSFEDIVAAIDAVDHVTYAQTRNHLNGAVSRLSPYISRGVVTLPFIRDRLVARTPQARSSKFVQELAWREYFQLVWQENGDEIFEDLRFKKDDTRHYEVVTAIETATTGIDTLDTAVRELYETGYLHNHARLFLASIASNIARADWLTMGKWMYAHLLDGDLASNFLSWQWVAGTSVSKRYYANQALINAWSSQAQQHSWLDVPMEALPALPCPEHMLSHHPFTLQTQYPESDTIAPVSGQVVYLYTPWTLDPQWRNAADADVARILVIDPVWFDRFPVSEKVLDFIIAQGKEVIPELEVWVGAPESIPGLTTVKEVYFKHHPTTTTWKGTRDPLERMFPLVTGYHPSFFSFWKAVQELYQL